MSNETNSNNHYFRINNLFEKEVKITADDSPQHTIKVRGMGGILRLNKGVVAEIEKSTGLLFLGKMEDGNVCFANNNDDLRDEFKQVFSPGEVLNYIYGVLNSPEYHHGNEFTNPEIPYPENAEIFWNYAASGSILR